MSYKLSLEKHKIPFLRSTTTLLHFLLDSGYDCVKPDSVIMDVANYISIVDEKMSDKNFQEGR